MNNESLFALQIHNLNRGLHNMALSLHKHITATTDEELQASFDLLQSSMADFHTTIDQISAAVQKANEAAATPQIILPH